MTTFELAPFLSLPAPDPATHRMAEIRAGLGQQLSRLEQRVVPHDLGDTSDLVAAFDTFAVKIALVGQAKSGKTSLANTLAGQVDLLPAIVNAWTPTVTSVHLNVPPPGGKRTVVKFIDREAWSELGSPDQASSSGSPANDLQAITAEMKDKTENALGPSFDKLLGRTLAFAECNAEIACRYLCIPQAEKLRRAEGRIADLTETMDLYPESDRFGYPAVISDLPGVDDPFRVREAIKVNGPNRTDIHVVVLSAQQALAAIDIGLMRLLHGLPSENVVIFVNRIDELADPVAALPLVDGQLRGLFVSQGMPDDTAVVYGSAAWAHARLTGAVDSLSDASIMALANLAIAREDPETDVGDQGHDANLTGLEDLSGMVALQRAIDRKAVRLFGTPTLTRIASRGAELAKRSVARILRGTAPTATRVEGLRIEDALMQLHNQQAAVAAAAVDQARDASERALFDLSSAFKTFAVTQGRNLRQAFEDKTAIKAWQPETEDLRKELLGVYAEIMSPVSEQLTTLASEADALIRRVYGGLLGEAVETDQLPQTEVPRHASPAVLRDVITLDFESPEKTGWIKRNARKEACLAQLEESVGRAMHDVISTIQRNDIEAQLGQMFGAIEAVIASQIDALEAIARLDPPQQRLSVRQRLGMVDAAHVRIAELEEIIHSLEDLIANEAAPSQESARA